jgi:hypothetical protein
LPSTCLSKRIATCEWFRSQVRPTQECGASSESRANGGEQHQVALLQSLFFQRRLHCQRDRACRGVAIAIDVDDDLLERQAQAFGGSRDDPPIGLMGDEAIYVVAGQAMFGQDFFRHLGHFFDRVLEDILSVLVDDVHFLVHGFVRRRMQAAASGHVQKLPAHALDLSHMINDAGLAVCGRLQ